MNTKSDLLKLAVLLSLSSGMVFSGHGQETAAEVIAEESAEAAKADTGAGSIPLIDFDGLEVGLRSVQDTNSLGIDISWDIWNDEFYRILNAPSQTGEAEVLGLMGRLDFEAFLGTESAESDNTPRQLNLGGDLYIEPDIWSYDLRLPGGSDDTQDWFTAFGITALEIEADQDFDAINYLFKPFVEVSIPYTEYVELGIRKIFGSDSPRLRPAFITGGYTLASAINDDGVRAGENRWEVALNYKIFSFYKNFEFIARDRFFWEDERNYNLLELELGIPVHDNFRIVAKYINGELPLSIQRSESISGGFSITF